MYPGKARRSKKVAKQGKASLGMCRGKASAEERHVKSMEMPKQGMVIQGKCRGKSRRNKVSA
jgi:hypothetical protein